MLKDEFNLFKEIIKYIPNLPPSFDKNLPLKREMFIYNKFNQKNNNMKCFKCKKITDKLLLLLRQTSSVSRTSDELIEIHHYCSKCAKEL